MTNSNKKNKVTVDNSKLIIIMDTRERETKHITDYFDGKGIQYESRKLDFGDYSVIYDDVDYSQKITIERKNSLEELSSNFTNERERIVRELDRAKNAEFTLLIEKGSLSDVINHKYKTQLLPNSFLGTILSMQSQYNLNVTFIDKENSGKIIHGFLYYYIRNILKNEG